MNFPQPVVGSGGIGEAPDGLTVDILVPTVIFFIRYSREDFFSSEYLVPFPVRSFTRVGDFIVRCDAERAANLAGLQA